MLCAKVETSGVAGAVKRHELLDQDNKNVNDEGSVFDVFICYAAFNLTG